MATIYDTTPDNVIKNAAEALKTQIKMPDWAKFVKTGAGRERTPQEVDWWYTRAAAVLRKIYLNGPIGVNKLRMEFGNKKNRGLQPEKQYKGGGIIIRVILQQLEEKGLIEKGERGVHKGRIVTNKGKSFLDKLAK